MHTFLKEKFKLQSRERTDTRYNVCSSMTTSISCGKNFNTFIRMYIKISITYSEIPYIRITKMHFSARQSACKNCTVFCFYCYENIIDTWKVNFCQFFKIHLYSYQNTNRYFCKIRTFKVEMNKHGFKPHPLCCLRPEQDAWHIRDHILKCIFLKEMSPKYVNTCMRLNEGKSKLVQVMTCYPKKH